jgi:hypothetical protein
MKQSPSEQALLRNLRPSTFSAQGFLGPDSRPIDEIISEDLRVLERHHVSQKTLVHALKRAYDLAQKALGADMAIGEGVTAKYYESMGRVPSPFQGDGVFEKGEVKVKDAQSGHTIIITRLGIHLIEKHGFFQGKGSPYRMEPIAAMKIFRLGAQDSEHPTSPKGGI